MTSDFSISRARPINTRLLIAIAGPQASGKTTSALRIATGIVKKSKGKICFIDTENKRSLTYANAFSFNHLSLDPPFSPERYDKAIQFAEKNGYGEGDVIIIDSMSHEHEGPGGVVEMHEEYINERLRARNIDVKNYKEREKIQINAWGPAKSGRKRLISYTLSRTKCHVILCFRAKEKIDLVKVNGKIEYIKEGLSPIGAEEYFYEMGISIILPLGSMGKPDWTAKSSRINEYGDEKPITDMFKRTEQLDESVGYFLASQSVQSDQETLVKSKCADIIRDVKDCEFESDVMRVLNDRADDIEFIKQASMASYNYIFNIIEDKKKSINNESTGEML